MSTLPSNISKAQLFIRKIGHGLGILVVGLIFIQSPKVQAQSLDFGYGADYIEPGNAGPFEKKTLGYFRPLAKGTPQSDPSILVPRDPNFTPPSGHAPNALAVLPDGNALMVGTTLVNGGRLKQIALTAVLSGGATTKGTTLPIFTKPVLTLTTPYEAEGQAVLIQRFRNATSLNAAYRVLVAGITPNNEIVLARYIPLVQSNTFSLTLDPFFGNRGIVNAKLPSRPMVEATIVGMDIHPADQSIFIFGNAKMPLHSVQSFFFLRFNSDGTTSHYSGRPYAKRIISMQVNGSDGVYQRDVSIAGIAFGEARDEVYFVGTSKHIKEGKKIFVMETAIGEDVLFKEYGPSSSSATVLLYSYDDTGHLIAPTVPETKNLPKDPSFNIILGHGDNAEKLQAEPKSVFMDKTKRLVISGDVSRRSGAKQLFVTRLKNEFLNINGTVTEHRGLPDYSFNGSEWILTSFGDPSSDIGDQFLVGSHYFTDPNAATTNDDIYVLTGIKKNGTKTHFAIKSIRVNGGGVLTDILTDNPNLIDSERLISSQVQRVQSGYRVLLGGETQTHLMVGRYSGPGIPVYQQNIKTFSNDIAIFIQPTPDTRSILPTNTQINYRVMIANFGPHDAQRVQVDIKLPLEIVPYETQISPNNFCAQDFQFSNSATVSEHHQYVVKCTIPLLRGTAPNNIYWFDLKVKVMAIGNNRLTADISQEAVFSYNQLIFDVADYGYSNNHAEVVHRAACRNVGDSCSSNMATLSNETCQADGTCSGGQIAFELCDLINSDGAPGHHTGAFVRDLLGPGYREVDPVDEGACYYKVENGHIVSINPAFVSHSNPKTICRAGRLYCSIKMQCGWAENVNNCNGKIAGYTLEAHACQGAIFPLEEEACNGYDDDCDGIVPDDEDDEDNDGILECNDNCPAVANPNQEDRTPGGTGDACACGDGVFELEQGEQCDDGRNNGPASQFCSTTCQLKHCGDGSLNIGEQCDLGSNNNNDGACTLGCRNAVCGDGFIRDGVEECDGPGSFDPMTEACENCAIREYICGDGKREGPEECDDGNRVDDDRCANDCKRPPACADGRARQDVLCMGFEGDSRNSGQCLSVLDNGIADFFSMVTGFNGPAGFHMDRQKNVFLYDASQRVFRFDTQRGGESVWIAQSHRFQEIRDLDVDSKGDVWVLDGAQIFKILVGSNPTLSAANVPVMELVLSPSGLNIQAIELDDQDRLLALDDQSILYGFQPTGNGNTYQSDPSNRFDLKTAINASGNSLFDSNSFERGDMALTDGALIISNRLGRRSTRTAPPFYSVGLPLVTNSVVTTLDFMDLPGSIAYGSLDGQKRLFASGASPSNASRTRMTMAGEEILQGRSVPAQTVSNNEFSLLTDLAVIRSCPLTLKAPCIPDPLGERCDGRDNDCDGDIDESDPALDQTCVSAQPGICSEGRNICRNGALQCQPLRLPDVTDTCIDSLDNDCDGLTDENCECQPGTTQNCSTPCGEGIQTCLNGRWSNACQINRPNPELCDGQDNNCNGQVDETFDVGENCPDPIAISEQCFVPSAKACRTDAGGTECVAKPGLEPVCNIVDPSRCEGIVQKYGEQITVNEAINLVEDARQQKDPFSPSSNITYVVEGSFVTGECVNAGYQLGGGNKMLGCSLQRESGEVSKVLAFMMIGWSLLIAALRLRRRRQ